MSLADLIRGKTKSVSGVATLTVATLATHRPISAPTVATVATVTVANPKSDLGSVSQALKRLAGELGYKWADLQGAGLIDDGELDYAVQNWRIHSEAEWRAYVRSVGLRARLKSNQGEG